MREELKRRAFTVWIAVEEVVAWERVEGSGRPLARERESFQRLYEERQPIYEGGRRRDRRGCGRRALARAPRRLGACPTLEPLSLGSRPIALVADPKVASLHPLQLDGSPSGRISRRKGRRSSSGWLRRASERAPIGREGPSSASEGGTTTRMSPVSRPPSTREGFLDRSPDHPGRAGRRGDRRKTGIDLTRGRTWSAPSTINGVIVDQELLATLPTPSAATGWPRS